MYSPNFGKHTRARIQVAAAKRVCQCCGSEIPKGNFCFAASGIQGNLSVCIPCCGEAFYRVQHQPLDVINEDIEVRLQAYKDEIERSYLHQKHQKAVEKEKVSDKLKEYQKELDANLEAERKINLDLRIGTLLKDYSASTIISFILEKLRG